MRVNINKIQLCQESIKLLDVTLNTQEITPSEIKQNEALEFLILTPVSELRRFLRLNRGFRNFIKSYAELTLCLTDTLKGKSKQFLWKDGIKRI